MAKEKWDDEQERSGEEQQYSEEKMKSEKEKRKEIVSTESVFGGGALGG